MTAQALAATLPKRSEVPNELTWDLCSIFATDSDWERDFSKVEAELPKLSAYAGKLSESGATLLKALEDRDRVEQVVAKLRCYASMKHHQDTTDGGNLSLFERSRTLVNKYSAAVSYITPEVLSLDPEKLKSFVSSTPGLELYQFALDDLMRLKPHVRSSEVEAVLAQSNELRGTPSSVYGQLTNADMKYPKVRSASGDEIELTDGNYVARFLQSADRGERQRAFEAMMGSYKAFRNSLSALYSAQVRGNIFNSRARNYKSSLEAALNSINVPTSVYTSLLDTVHANIPKLNRYLDLRKRVLGVDKLHMYDLYVPIVAEAEYPIKYQDAQKTVLKALAPLGDQYVAALANGFQSRWIDVMENHGKRSGAYSGGAYGTNPFILLNWQDCLDAMFTLAHEAGHSMHSYFTRKTQPYPYGNYTIFVAEVASTCNEALLRHHLLKTVDDKNVRMLIINDALEGFRTTLYRQALFAEFEKQAHEKAERGEALTADSLCGIFYELNREYYGGVCDVDQLIENEWARIPHFYSSFYVYQYCTGISAGAALAEQMMSEGEPAIKRYLKFLSSGSSDYSINLLRDAGVDLSSPAPVQQALNTFEQYLHEFEQLIG